MSWEQIDREVLAVVCEHEHAITRRVVAWRFPQHRVGLITTALRRLSHADLIEHPKVKSVMHVRDERVGYWQATEKGRDVCRQGGPLG